MGAIGKYEYRHYVRRVGHTEQIEYHCAKGHKRVGPQGATCVDGKWSPPKEEKPQCIPGKHPKLLQIFRGRRSVQSEDDDLAHEEEGEEREEEEGVYTPEGKTEPKMRSLFHKYNWINRAEMPKILSSGCEL